MDVENSNGDGIYKCDVCNFESQYSQNLQIHFKSLKHMTNIDAWTLEFTNNETNGFEEPKSNIRKSIGRYHSKFFVQVWHLVEIIIFTKARNICKMYSYIIKSHLARGKIGVLINFITQKLKSLS